MPAELLETAARIFRAEAQDGYRDRVVIGGNSERAISLLKELYAPFVRTENPILVNDFSAPLPDFALIRGTANDYARRGSVPNPGEIGLVVEVAEDLPHDRWSVFASA